jgi:hypothetical protein
MEDLRGRLAALQERLEAHASLRVDEWRDLIEALPGLATAVQRAVERAALAGIVSTGLYLSWQVFDSATRANVAGCVRIGRAPPRAVGDRLFSLITPVLSELLRLQSEPSYWSE